MRRGVVEFEEGQVHYSEEAGERHPDHLPLLLYHVRHTSVEFVAFLTDIVANRPKAKEIHVIADNLPAHKTTAGPRISGHSQQRSYAFHPNVLVVAEPKSSCGSPRSSAISVLAVFTSVPDLRTKLIRYLRKYNAQLKWKYCDLSRRITPHSIVTVH